VVFYIYKTYGLYIHKNSLAHRAVLYKTVLQLDDRGSFSCLPVSKLQKKKQHSGRSAMIRLA
jgi:hypothetical protein